MKWKVMLIRDYYILHEERVGTRLRCYLMGLVWKYFRDLTYKGRIFYVVDNK